MVSDLLQMYNAVETVRAPANSPGPIVPGHDRLKIAHYPAAPGRC